jgi:hypothetical protein
MNFYLPPLFNFGQELSQRGHHSFVINTRGHDWISRAGNLTKFGGSAYENLEDCVADFDGAIEFLKRHGYGGSFSSATASAPSNQSSIRAHSSAAMSSASSLARRPSNSTQNVWRASRSFVS